MYGSLYVSRPGQPSPQSSAPQAVAGQTTGGFRPVYNGQLGVRVPAGGSVGRPAAQAPAPIPVTTSGVPVVGGNGGGRAMMIPRNPYTYGPDRFGNIVAQQPDYVQVDYSRYRFGQ